MLLFTSSSETVACESAVEVKRGSAVRQVLVLLVIVGCAVAGLELFARFGVERGSKVQRMVNQEYREAIAIRPGSDSSPRQLLVVGNSLVGHCVDLDELRHDLPSGWQAHRFWIYNTLYEDWYLGLRRLFAEGSRPNTVALVFAAMHWYATGTRGDYSAQYLFQARDIGVAQQDLDLSETGASSLLFAHYSKFYALRSEIRKVFLERLMPSLPEMSALFQPGVTRTISDEEIVRVVAPRMRALKELTDQYGTRLVFVVPPIRDGKAEHHAALRTAAESAGVRILMPMASKDMNPARFEDDLHLDETGARLFTAALGTQLDGVLDSGR